jgi:hypothetical protein
MKISPAILRFELHGPTREPNRIPRTVAAKIIVVNDGILRFKTVDIASAFLPLIIYGG